MNDKPKSNCGIVGIYNNDNASVLAYYSLMALQHRGQEACGIITQNKLNDNQIKYYSIKGKGLVNEVFNEENLIYSKLIGKNAIGHTRYSTTGSEISENIQPFLIKYKSGNLAISHNGNLTNSKNLRRELESLGSIFRSSSDTEIFLHLISKAESNNQLDQIIYALTKVIGAYSLVILGDNAIYGIRDPYGVRPLVIGKKDKSYFLASETCAFDILKAEYIREVFPGEIVIIDDETVRTEKIKSVSFVKEKPNPKKCIFEYIYFSRPDSIVFGENVDKVRRKLGKVLASESSDKATETTKLKVISVPDSSNTIAIGYNDQLRKSQIPSKLEIGLIRSHYIGRTFIQPGQDKRELGVRIKFNIVKGVLKDQRVVIVDDSIVRGTTSKLLVNLIREAQPKEIHLRIASPPIISPCYYGMDFPDKNELIAHLKDQNIEKIKEEIGVDSLKYLSLEGLISAVPGVNKDNYCVACFTGEYPIPIDADFKKDEYDN